MYPVPKNKSPSHASWQSYASNETLIARAEFLRAVRAFFESRGVVEVDTPVLMRGVITDPFICVFQCQDHYLQTSPEFAMKRLLAQGMGAIYYLGKAFRQAEVGRYHNPEFTMLEWYRPGWDLSALIDETVTLIRSVTSAPEPVLIEFAELFSALTLDPHSASKAELAMRAQALFPDQVQGLELDRTGWLDWLFMQAIEPKLDPNQLYVITDYPADCAQLSKLIPHPQYGQVATRFEIFYQGMELANGYHELTDPIEQQQRFEQDNQKRNKLGLPERPLDHHLLSALQAGIGEVSGVAVGADRLLMIKLGVQHLREILPFDWERA